MLIPTGFAQVNITYEVGTWPYRPQNVFGVKTTEFVGTTTEFAEAIYDIWVAEMCAYMTTDVDILQARVKYGPNATGPTEDWNGAASGDETGPTTQPAECMLIRKNTSLGGRQGRGRFYLPGMRSTFLTPSGLWDSSLVTSQQTEVNQWLAAMIAADIPPVLLHGVGTSDTTPEDIVSLTVDSRVATQRRRNRR